jgi:hypothetical protein
MRKKTPRRTQKWMLPSQPPAPPKNKDNTLVRQNPPPGGFFMLPEFFQAIYASSRIRTRAFSY